MLALATYLSQGDATGVSIDKGTVRGNGYFLIMTGAVTFITMRYPKLATTATGIDVTGTVVADGLTVDVPSTQDIIFQRDGGGSGKLELDFASQFTNFNSVVDGFKFYHGGIQVLQMRSGDISFYEDTGTTAKFYWDSSAESLGIGTTSVSDPLHIKAERAIIRLEPTAVGGTTYRIRNGISGGSEGGLSFYDVTNAATRLAIDSSGNLLVGKTASNSTVAGSQLNANGLIIGTTSATNPLLLNRLSTDGSIAEFRKDGTTVGSIGTASGVVQYSGSAKASFGAGDVGLFANPDNDALYPVFQTTLGGRDAAIDLGLTGNRFKDLYLSGGVYLGGTGSANKLDDYEEGNWAPTLVPDAGTPPTLSTSNSGRYTKVGRLVTLIGYIQVNSISGNVANFALISGIPFAPLGGAGYEPVGGITLNGLNLSRPDNAGLAAYSTTTLGLLTANNNGGWGWETFAIFTGGDAFRFTISYYTT